MEETSENQHVLVKEMQHQSLRPNEIALIEGKDVVIAREEISENPEAVRIRQNVAIQTYLEKEIIIPKNINVNFHNQTIIGSQNGGSYRMELGSSQENGMDISSQESALSSMDCSNSQEISNGIAANSPKLSDSLVEGTISLALEKYSLPKHISKNVCRKRRLVDSSTSPQHLCENSTSLPEQSRETAVSVREEAVSKREAAVLKCEIALKAGFQKVKSVLTQIDDELNEMLLASKEMNELRELALKKQEGALQEMQTRLTPSNANYVQENGCQEAKRSKTDDATGDN